MKKTKPVKGSARAKKFDAGGLAALAGLGALAYMMRKKKGESEGSAPKDKSGYSSGPVDVGRMIEGRGDEEPSAEVKRAMAASKGRSDLIPEGADEAAMRSDVGAKRAMPAPRRAAATPAKKADTTSESSNTTPSTYYTPKAKSAEPTAKSKPYPKGVKGTTTDPYQRPSLNLGVNERAQAGKSFRERLAAEGKERMAAEEKAKAARRKGVADTEYDAMGNPIMKRGGAVKASKMGTVKQAKPSMGSASKRADGIAQRGKTRGRML